MSHFGLSWPEGGTMSKRELKVSRRSLDDNGYELPATRDQTISLVAMKFIVSLFPKHIFFAICYIYGSGVYCMGMDAE